METPVTNQSQTLMTESPKNNLLPMIMAFILIIGAGIGTGYALSLRNKSTSNNTSKSAAMIKTANEAGTMDTKTFKDFAAGTLEEGGINGEGTHKLIRPGGNSQTVYLISSLVDLEPFVGKKVEVYGQTIKAKTAGWLMDVGRIKVVE